MGRILAIDYGTKRTGIAVSDPQRIIAGGLDTLPTAQLMPWLAEYGRLRRSRYYRGGASRADGRLSERYACGGRRIGQEAGERFPAVRVVMFDERFTSVLAHRAMLDGGMKRMQRRDKAAVDRISATILLQGFMESRMYEEMKNR